ncbi:pentatricopeptide repeat (PPR-like) superfamily protein [Striga asiatica]|uniref:Pentatricopeptide repeat (PPR-like) superfamily protein n=1 Tax=Striga asiatica TaxID=4170 RepID=A0A5A7R7L8_STRAF|nr:pentatricopeptide repeat (PPR-like) superfamily protein [Striga asiatica]
MYKRKFWFEENDYDVPESYFYHTGEKIQLNTIELVKRFLKQLVKVDKAVLTSASVLFLTLTAEEDGGPVQTIQAAVYEPRDVLPERLTYPSVFKAYTRLGLAIFGTQLQDN